MINQELEAIRTQLTNKQQFYLNAIISGKTETEARRVAGYSKPPKSELLKRAVEIVQSETHNQALSIRDKAIDFNYKLLSKLETINNSLNSSNYEKCEPVAVIREMRQVQAEISKLQGLYIEQEEEKQGITKEEEEQLLAELESLTD